MRLNNRLWIFPFITVLFFLVPVGVGLVCTWLPAFGYLPVVGAKEFGFQHFSNFWNYPGILSSLQASLVSGFVATILSFVTALWLTVSLYDSKAWRLIEKSIAPLLAIPHASFAIGFGFLLVPSGWFFRVISPALTGFESPPDLLILGDPYGISLSVILALKEIPFFLLMILAALSQLDTKKIIWLGRSLGYCKTRVWGRLLIPQIFPHLRLPFMAVLAYSLSVVDIAMLVGPSKPATLAVVVNSWFYSPDAEMRLLGAAGATVLCGLVCFAIFVCVVIERCFALWRGSIIINGSRSCLAEKLRWTGLPCVLMFCLLYCLTIIGLFLQSIALRWRFPDSFPTSFTLKFWFKGFAQSLEAVWSTMLIGSGATIIAIILVIGCLEYEVLRARMGRKINVRNIFHILYIPLIVPQIAFIFGIQVVAVSLNIDGYLASLIAVHLIFVLPYVFLTLAHPYRNFDQRYYDVALSLTGSRFRSFAKIKLSMLFKPICFSMACGFSVSVVQYLPTLYVGAGRFATITTETVALASGSDRRIAAVYALLQFALPVLAYGLAVIIPLVRYRHHSAMQS